MKIIGIAGKSGTGKSTIAAHLTMRGGAHIDADQVGHEVLESDEDAREDIRQRIGEDVFDAEGHIDRRRLGARVFNDADLLVALNEIVHPAIRRECERTIERLEAAGVPFAVVDAALLLDSEMPFTWDLLIALVCDEEELFMRLMGKGGRTEAEVRQRLESQRGMGESVDRADVVLDTCRPRDEVLADADALIDELLSNP
jgi:dephospho-CoA kinase